MKPERKKYSFLECKAKIEYFCAYQERCHSEVQKKLLSWGMDQEQTDNLVADLITNNFLNEGRFAEAFVSGKFRIKKWGRNKIRLHLKQKKVSEYSINKAFAEMDEEEYLETLQELLEKKYREAKGNVWEKRKKTSSFLINKGYEGDLIRESLDKTFPIK